MVTGSMRLNAFQNIGDALNRLLVTGGFPEALRNPSDGTRLRTVNICKFKKIFVATIAIGAFFSRMCRPHWDAQNSPRVTWRI